MLNVSRFILSSEYGGGKYRSFIDQEASKTHGCAVIYILQRAQLERHPGGGGQFNWYVY